MITQDKEEILKLLQGKWDGGQSQSSTFEISGEDVTILSTSNPGQPSELRLDWNSDFKAWHISSLALMWGVTLLQQVSENSFTIYDYDAGLSTEPEEISGLPKPVRKLTFNRVS